MRTTQERIREIKRDIEEQFDYDDLSGQRVLKVLDDLETLGATVYWGCIPLEVFDGYLRF